MLEQRLRIPYLLALQLFANQPNLPTEQFGLDYQPAPVYAQASKEELSSRLGEEADKLKEKKLQDALRPYQNKIKRGKLNEAEIRKIGDLYKKLAIGIGANSSDIQEAIGFFTLIINNYPKSRYRAEAHLNLGKINCCVLENNDDYKAAKHLEESYRRSGNLGIKANALFLLGTLHLRNFKEDNRFDEKKGTGYLQQLIETIPRSEFATQAKTLLASKEEETHQEYKGLKGIESRMRKRTFDIPQEKIYPQLTK